MRSITLLFACFVSSVFAVGPALVAIYSNPIRQWLLGAGTQAAMTLPHGDAFWRLNTPNHSRPLCQVYSLLPEFDDCLRHTWVFEHQRGHLVRSAAAIEELLLPLVLLGIATSLGVWVACSLFGLGSSYYDPTLRIAMRSGMLGSKLRLWFRAFLLGTAISVLVIVMIPIVWSLFEGVRIGFTRRTAIVHSEMHYELPFGHCIAMGPEGRLGVLIAAGFSILLAHWWALKHTITMRLRSLPDAGRLCRACLYPQEHTSDVCSECGTAIAQDATTPRRGSAWFPPTPLAIRLGIALLLAALWCSPLVLAWTNRVLGTQFW